MNKRFNRRPEDAAFDKDSVRYNERIRIPQVQVIHEGKNLGVMSNKAALELARKHELDLVEVAPNAKPPVCHIINYGKFMFERNKKKKELATKHGKPEKEVEFRYTIGPGDLETKSNQVRNFLIKGHKVKCVCKFKRRENAHKDLGFELLNKVIDLVGDVGVVEMPPKFEGNTLLCRLEGKKS